MSIITVENISKIMVNGQKLQYKNVILEKRNGHIYGSIAKKAN